MTRLLWNKDSSQWQFTKDYFVTVNPSHVIQSKAKNLVFLRVNSVKQSQAFAISPWIADLFYEKNRGQKPSSLRLTSCLPVFRGCRTMCSTSCWTTLAVAPCITCWGSSFGKAPYIHVRDGAQIGIAGRHCAVIIAYQPRHLAAVRNKDMAADAGDIA